VVRVYRIKGIESKPKLKSFGMLRQSGLGFQGRCACAAVRKVIS
jgi:hypothetical protein